MIADAGACQAGNRGECPGDGEVCCANLKIEYKCVEADQCLDILWVFTV